jgi:hypothetical protein
MKMSRSGSTSPFSTRKPVPIDEEMAEPASTSSGRAGRCDDGEDEEDMDDLGRQLELARKNSESARGSLADHHLRGRQAAASEGKSIESPPRNVSLLTNVRPACSLADEFEPPREVLKRPQTPPLDEAMRRAKSPPVLDDVFGGGLRAKSPGVAERRPHGPRGPTTSRATTPSRASTPIRSTTPIGPTAPLRLYPASPVGDRAGLGLGAGPSPSQQPSSAAKKGRSRRVSDEWRNARPSPVAAVPSTTPGPLEETPDSPSSVSSGQKRERRGSVDEPSPVLDKKIRTSDGRSPLSPIRNASTAAQLPPVTGLSIRRSSLPPGSAPAQAPRKVSGAGVTKRIFEAEKAATSAHVEDRILGAARATLEDVRRPSYNFVEKAPSPSEQLSLLPRRADLRLPPGQQAYQARGRGPARALLAQHWAEGPLAACRRDGLPAAIASKPQHLGALPTFPSVVLPPVVLTLRVAVVADPRQQSAQ